MTQEIKILAQKVDPFWLFGWVIFNNFGGTKNRILDYFKVVLDLFRKSFPYALYSILKGISACDMRLDRWSCTLSVTTRVAVIYIVSEGNYLQAVNPSLCKKRKLYAI